MSEPRDGTSFGGNRSSDGMPDALQRARNVANAKGDFINWQKDEKSAILKLESPSG